MIYLFVVVGAVVLQLSMSTGRDGQQNVSFQRENKSKGAKIEANERHIPIATKVPAMYCPHPLLLGTKRSSATPPQAT